MKPERCKVYEVGAWESLPGLRGQRILRRRVQHLSQYRLKYFLIVMGLVFSIGAKAIPLSAPHPCATGALQRAEKLLALQSESDQPGAVSKKVIVLKPLRNPANAKQKFDVLSVTGFVYKAEFRMRFLYAQIPGQCALVGQEILERTGL